MDQINTKNITFPFTSIQKISNVFHTFSDVAPCAKT